jgi:DNA-binding transcriptional LysR family regulator
MAEYAEVALVQRLAESFARSAAWATLRIVPLTGAEVAERLDREVIDVAAAHLGPLPAHFDTTVLLMDPFVLVARRGHSLTARPVTVEAYAARSHVLVSPRGDTVGAVDRALAAQGLKRRIALLVATTWRCRWCSGAPTSSRSCRSARPGTSPPRPASRSRRCRSTFP